MNRKELMKYQSVDQLPAAMSDELYTHLQTEEDDYGFSVGKDLLTFYGYLKVIVNEPNLEKMDNRLINGLRDFYEEDYKAFCRNSNFEFEQLG